MVGLDFALVFQWINFALLLFILYKVMYKPLLAFLDKRADGISSNINEALNNKEQSLKVLEEYKAKMQGIAAEADALVIEARKKAGKEKDRILEEARDQSQVIIDAAKGDIEREVFKAREKLKQDMSQLVIACSEKVLEREIKDADHHKAIEDFLNS